MTGWIRLDINNKLFLYAVNLAQKILFIFLFIFLSWQVLFAQQKKLKFTIIPEDKAEQVEPSTKIKVKFN